MLLPSVREKPNQRYNPIILNMHINANLQYLDLHKIYYDDESYNKGHGHVYEHLGIDPAQGAIIIVRPDQCKCNTRIKYISITDLSIARCLRRDEPSGLPANRQFLCWVSQTPNVGWPPVDMEKRTFQLKPGFLGAQQLTLGKLVLLVVDCDVEAPIAR